MSEIVTLQQLAEEFRIDRSTVRKFVRGHGFEPVLVRSRAWGNQCALGFTEDEANRIREMRRARGFELRSPESVCKPKFLYLVQPIPEYAPQRLAIGLALDIDQRLSEIRHNSPNAVLLVSWSCPLQWQKAAFACLIAGLTPLGGECYACKDIGSLLVQGHRFFERPRSDAA